MRTITAWMISSLDGVVDQPERWSSPYMNEEVNAEIGAGMAPSGTLDTLELTLNICPIVLGSGLRLFDDTTGQMRLELVESKTYSTGVLRAGYCRAGA